MKNITLLLLFLISYSGFCQEGNLQLDDKKQVFYSDSGKSQKSKAELYKSAQDWVVNRFGNYANAVTFEDADSGRLIISSYVPVSHSAYQYIRFNLAINCKGDGYQASIDILDGISEHHDPVRLSNKENDAVLAKEVAIKTESDRKKRLVAEERWKLAKSDNESVNTAMYSLLAGLKQFMIAEKE